ncbi:RAMP superfamily CRISPR-associated protein [Streptomyces sp. NPDC002896]|uniref:RAMP superfamily CRISPR-associated protein n=1 Tax=Streptomyces sp. NPDC002896 TaxID=3154438 RepID=UPI0033166DCC
MKVRIDFHGPFRVSTGRAAAGANDTVDDLDLLPASSLKGVMRASAALLLPERKELLDAVFGAARRPSRWHWSGATVQDVPVVTQRARIAIDPNTGAARKNHLLFAEEIWARTASFSVTRTGPLTADDERTHLTVLACAAAGVHALGADRRRGLGWVTCTPLDPPVDDELLARFEDLRSRDA